MSRMIWSLLNRIRKPDDPSSDAEIIRRFVQNRDEAAFELLVWRHGSLVLSVCRRMVRDDHAAEDAFQATFLILAKKAASVRGSLPGWLHQVARRVCLRARQRIAQEPVAKLDLAAPVADSAESLHRTELADILDEEIAGLPKRLRLAVVHCYLQGRTAEDAAKLLSIPRGTVLSRLFHARKLLTVRLNRRGIVAPATLVTGSLALPTISADVCRRTVQAAIGFVNRSIPATLSTQLAHEVLDMSAHKTAYTLAAVMIVLAGLGTGVGMVMAQTGGDGPAKAVAKAVEVSKPVDQPKEEAKPLLESQKQVHEERIAQLRNSERTLSKLLDIHQEEKARLIQEAAAEVDPKALQQKLEKIDEEILDNEKSIEHLPMEIEMARKHLGEIKSGRLNEIQKNHMENRLIEWMNQFKEVNQALQQFRKYQETFLQMDRQQSPDADLRKEAVRLMKDAQNELHKAREIVKAREIKTFTEKHMIEIASEAESEIKQKQEALDIGNKVLNTSREKRVKLVMRFQNAKSKLDAQQQIDDEIQTLRDIRKQVLKERLMLEMGLTAPMK